MPPAYPELGTTGALFLHLVGLRRSLEGRTNNPRLRAVCDDVLARVRKRLEKATLAELAKGTSRRPGDIVGKTDDGKLAGVKTTVVET
jgi:hypothetical protein